jgi:methionine synthase II (cobalamin-independent)
MWLNACGKLPSRSPVSGATSSASRPTLSGPVTILAWSFVRTDQPLGDTARQVGPALRDDVRDLEAASLRIVQRRARAARAAAAARRGPGGVPGLGGGSVLAGHRRPRRLDADPHPPVLLGVRRRHRRDRLWVNPDCRLKIRGEAETVATLDNLVAAAHAARIQ